MLEGNLGVTEMRPLLKGVWRGPLRSQKDGQRKVPGARGARDIERAPGIYALMEAKGEVSFRRDLEEQKMCVSSIRHGGLLCEHLTLLSPSSGARTSLCQHRVESPPP